MYKSDEVYLTCYLLCCTCYVGYLFLEPSSKACSQARYLVPNVCRIYNMKAIKDMTSSQKVEAELPHQGGAVLNYIATKHCYIAIIMVALMLLFVLYMHA